jgi:uncharacterized protein with PIN domain
MNAVDSSAWLEFFADGPNAGEFAAAIEDADSLIVPTISLFEVFNGSALNGMPTRRWQRLRSCSEASRSISMPTWRSRPRT